MSKKLYAVYILAILLLPIFLLVAIKLKSPSEIIEPPGVYGVTAEVQEAFEASLPADARNNITLKYPTSGENTTAFVMENLDNDDENEVIVFYALNSDESTVRMNVLDYINGHWESVYDEPGYGSEIISVVIDDLNKDGDPEIICNWRLYDNQTSNVVSLYSVKTGKGVPIQLNVLATQTVSFSDIADIDNDGKDEIIIIWNDVPDKNVTSLPKSSAAVLKMLDDDKIVHVGKTITVDSSVSTYGKMKLQNMENRTIAFIDAYKGQDAMITEVLLWDADNLRTQ